MLCSYFFQQGIPIVRRHLCQTRPGLRDRRECMISNASTFVTQCVTGWAKLSFYLNLSKITKAEESLPTSNFRLPTSDFRLPTSVAMKGGKMLLVPKTFFFSLLLGRLCSRRFWLSRLLHIERSWRTYRCTVVNLNNYVTVLSP